MKSPQLFSAQEALYLFLRDAVPAPSGFRPNTTVAQRAALGIGANTVVLDTSKLYGPYFKWQPFEAMMAGVKPFLVIQESEGPKVTALVASIENAIDAMLEAGNVTFMDIYFTPVSA